MTDVPRKTVLSLLILVSVCLSPMAALCARSHAVQYDSLHRCVRIFHDKLQLVVSVGGQCVVESLFVGDRQILDPGRGAFTGIMSKSTWLTTEELSVSPRVELLDSLVRITGIRYSAGPDPVEERWTFSFTGEDIEWNIERTLPAALAIDEEAFPVFHFRGLDEFDGAILGNGGVAWFYLFNDSAMAYGVHSGRATLWKASTPLCLDLTAESEGRPAALAFARSGPGLSCSFSAPSSEARYRSDPGTYRRRFVRKTTAVWQSMTYPLGTYRQSVRISARPFEREFGRGSFKGIDGEAVTAMMNTIGRLGVIDSKLFGGNSWHTPYGPICLQEQYIGRFGIGIDDERYTNGYKECLNYYRDHAILPDGRVKARWAYTDEDAIPGSADTLGFYEAQWGIMLDSNPDFVINVADEFGQCGDTLWLRTHKSSCEHVLDYMLRRDSDRDSLIEMLTDSHKEGRGSDWLDVIWASWENALVNAEMYHALVRWSELERLLGDSVRASAYLRFSEGLKRQFNLPTAEGGLWDASHGWYVHWREKDGTVFGDNLVTPVNFMAIAYGICDDPARRIAILRTIEHEMQKEQLFFWPICIFPYEAGAGGNQNYPYPSYENGDIFLSWGELGVRAYAEDFPDIALRYITKLVGRYKQDGLAFQRYLRNTQRGAGDDILGGNAAAITGLYSTIYGIEPKHDRLSLHPRLVEELYGTDLRYRFQGNEYRIAYEAGNTSVDVEGWTVESWGDFGIKKSPGGVRWFRPGSPAPDLTMTGSANPQVRVSIIDWSGGRRWTAIAEKDPATVVLVVGNCRPGSKHSLVRDGRIQQTAVSSENGTVQFSSVVESGRKQLFEVRPASIPPEIDPNTVLEVARPSIMPGDTVAFAPGAIRFAMSSETRGAVIRYRLDGSIPDLQSNVYIEPFDVSGSAVVKARAWRDGLGESQVSIAEVKLVSRGPGGVVNVGGKDVMIHKAFHSSVRLAHPFSPQYPASGPLALTDGRSGSDRYDVDWQGFERDDLDATIDLGEAMRVDSVGISFLENTGLWIFLPVNVIVGGSTDGKKFETIGSSESIQKRLHGSTRWQYVAPGNGTRFRYIRVQGINRGVCPPGHPGAGGKAWLFADEIIVK